MERAKERAQATEKETDLNQRNLRRVSHASIFRRANVLETMPLAGEHIGRYTAMMRKRHTASGKPIEDKDEQILPLLHQDHRYAINGGRLELAAKAMNVDS